MRSTPFTPNREFIADQLGRAQRHHCPTSLAYELDLSETLPVLEAVRQRGGEVSLTALLVKATGLVLERHPRLNRHVFRRFMRRVEVEFDEISCTLVLRREGPAAEELLFPLLVRRPNQLSLAEIHAVIRHHQQEPLERLPQMAAFRRIQRMSWLARRYFSYKARSDPGFYARYYGSYGLSVNMARDFGPVAGAGVANTGIAFVPGVIRELPRVVGGEIRARRILAMGVIFDHYLLDGGDVARAMESLRPLVESPTLLAGL